MSLTDPLALAQEIALVQAGVTDDDFACCIGDRHQRLWEAASQECCPDGDLLALMPSVDRPHLPWIDGRGWIARILGF